MVFCFGLRFLFFGRLVLCVWWGVFWVVGWGFFNIIKELGSLGGKKKSSLMNSVCQFYRGTIWRP